MTSSSIQATPLVTAVMLTNGRKERCLDCVQNTAKALKNSSGGILVINNGAEPINIPAVIENIPCRTLSIGTNLGVGARNLPIADTESEFLVMLDDDAYIKPESITAMLRIFRNDNSVGAVAFTVSNSNGEESCLLPTVFHGCACGFRTSVLREIGGYPDHFLYYGEEYHLVFRIYQAGYRIVAVEDPALVFHARDSIGRDMSRIIRLLIRNNLYLWAQALPAKYIASCALDTIKRYALVARKENAVKGFIQGCCLAPLSLARGLASRRPLSEHVAEKILLLDRIREACSVLQANNIKKITICGAGKFPSLWINAFRKHEIHISEIWDTNTCWHNSTIKNIPVRVISTSEKPENINAGNNGAMITGLASSAERKYWQNFFAERGMHRLSPEKLADTGTFDLLNDTGLHIYKTL